MSEENQPTAGAGGVDDRDRDRGEAHPRDGRADPDGGGGLLTPPSAASTTGYGLTVTVVGGVLLALAYYGYVAVRGARELGQALPEPFYLLALAVLFVVELLRSRHLGGVALLRAVAFAAAYGALFVFAVEGGAYLWRNPNVALAGFRGVTVLAVALVVAAVGYFVYLSAMEGGRPPR